MRYIDLFDHNAMPMGKKPCSYPGCPALITKGQYCLTHERPEMQRKRREQDARRMRCPETAEAFRFRSSARWQRIRRIKLISDPICEDPHGYHASERTTETATEIHHIQSIQNAPHLRDDMTNLMSVCRRCHDTFSAQERRESKQNTPNT